MLLAFVEGPQRREDRHLWKLEGEEAEFLSEPPKEPVLQVVSDFSRPLR